MELFKIKKTIVWCCWAFLGVLVASPTAIADTVPQLIEALKNTDLNVRAKAAEDLLKKGPVAVPALVRSLKSDNSIVSRSSAYVLVKMGRASVPGLITELKERDPIRVVDVLGQIGPDAKQAVPALLESMRNMDFKVRQGVAVALGGIGPGAKKAVPALIQAMIKDMNPDVRATAADALGQIGPLAVPALIKVLKSKNPGVSGAAKTVLEAIGTKEARQAVENYKKQ